MKNKRGKEWGTGWDGKSRVPDKQYKENYNSIDWSSVLTPEQHETNLLEKEIERKYDKNKFTNTSKK
jgi:hypothetical protein